MMNWSQLKGKIIKEAEQIREDEITIYFTDGSYLMLNSEGGHEIMLSEVTSDWVSDPIEATYIEAETYKKKKKDKK
jgi:hypothetical protein